MAHLYKDTGVKSLYSDRKFMGGKDAWQDSLENSTTLYIGNLSFFTTEEQVLVGPHGAGLAHTLLLPRGTCRRRAEPHAATAAGPLRPPPKLP